MAREANASLFMEFTWDQAHVGDVVKGRDALWYVESYTKRNLRTKVTLVRQTDQHRESWELDTQRIVTLQMEHECQCNGTGVHYGRGHVENGVFKGTTGTCYGCGGKGYQSRSDVIRNFVYWSQHARV